MKAAASGRWKNIPSAASAIQKRHGTEADNGWRRAEPPDLGGQGMGIGYPSSPERGALYMNRLSREF